MLLRGAVEDAALGRTHPLTVEAASGSQRFFENRRQSRIMRKPKNTRNWLLTLSSVSSGSSKNAPVINLAEDAPAVAADECQAYAWLKHEGRLRVVVADACGLDARARDSGTDGQLRTGPRPTASARSRICSRIGRRTSPSVSNWTEKYSGNTTSWQR